jgi:hypothetical protein
MQLVAAHLGRHCYILGHIKPNQIAIIMLGL